jgi:hypothetical protein
MNTIVESKTVEVPSSEGPIHAIMVAANITEIATLREFVGQVAERVKVQRLISPPTTDHLLVTVRGEAPAASLKLLWKEHVALDPVLRALMGKMRVADLVRAGATGPALEKVSLIG